MIRAAIVEDAIDLDRLIDDVSAVTNGAIAIFLGTVRNSNAGREVTGIEYSAYSEMAVAEMTRILEEAREKHGIASALIEHRVGSLRAGDASIAIVTASPHRRSAIDAMNYIIEETKSRAPIWKLEHYTDGTREWVGAGTS
jgi:molybdopterin synthase catalytic subunit